MIGCVHITTVSANQIQEMETLILSYERTAFLTDLSNFELRIWKLVWCQCNWGKLMSGKYILFRSVLLQQRFGVMDIKALGVSQLLGLGQTML